MENTDFKDGETLRSYSTSDRIGIHHIETKKKKNLSRKKQAEKNGIKVPEP